MGNCKNCILRTDEHLTSNMTLITHKISSHADEYENVNMIKARNDMEKEKEKEKEKQHSKRMGRNIKPQKMGPTKFFKSVDSTNDITDGYLLSNKSKKELSDININCASSKDLLHSRDMISSASMGILSGKRQKDYDKINKNLFKKCYRKQPKGGIFIKASGEEFLKSYALKKEDIGYIFNYGNTTDKVLNLNPKGNFEIGLKNNFRTAIEQRGIKTPILNHTLDAIIKLQKFFTLALKGKGNCTYEDHLLDIAKCFVAPYDYDINTEDKKKKVLYFLLDFLLVISYFSVYPYEYGRLTDSEIKEIVMTDYNSEEDRNHLRKDDLLNITRIIQSLAKKIRNNENILNEYSLHNLQKYALRARFRFVTQLDYVNKLYPNIQYYKDIDFCLKKLFYVYVLEKNEYYQSLANAFRITEKRMNLDRGYLDMANQCKHNTPLTEDQITSVSDSTRINEILAVGEDDFLTLINYLQLENYKYKVTYMHPDSEFENFFRRPKRLGQYKVANYYILTDVENAEKFYSSLMLLSNHYGIFIFLVIYSEDPELRVRKIDAMSLNIGSIPIILVRSEEDITNYFYDNKYYFKNRIAVSFNYYLSALEEDESEDTSENQSKKEGKANESLSISGIDMPKNLYLDTEKEEDDCFTLMEKYDLKYAKMAYPKVNKYPKLTVDPTSSMVAFYNCFKENDIQYLFFRHYANYLSFNFYPETSSNLLSYKQFLYALTLEEKSKGLLQIINSDLSSENSERILRHIPLINQIQILIDLQQLMTYNGRVFRAIRLEEDFLKQLKVGTKIINSGFWFASKKEKTEKEALFQETDSKNQKNVLICTKSTKHWNVDLHTENIFNENEEIILFLPFSSFVVKEMKSIKDIKGEYIKLILEPFLTLNEKGL
ncbi:MAG: hypothetical protein MJ252_20925 [archaeon]|nr:hypothetical protein [archaeon]